MSQIKKGAILSYISIGLTNVIGLVITPFIVKSLGDSEYGLYSLIGALIGYLTVMDLGLNNTIIRYVSKFRAEKDIEGEQQFLGTTMIIYFFISFLVLCVGLLFYINLERMFGQSLTAVELRKSKTMMIILIINLMISLPGGSFNAICNAYENFVFPRILSIVRYISRSILVYIILKMGADSIGLVILDTIISVLAILVSMLFVVKRIKVTFKFSGFEKKTFSNIFSYSIWIFIFAMISQMQWKGGQFVIGARLDTVSVGIYAIGILLGTYYSTFSGAISSLFLPRATQMAVSNASPRELTDMMIKIARFSAFALIIVFVGFLFLGRDFIILWLNKNYSDAYYISLIVMVGYTIPLLQNFGNSLLEAKKLFKFKALVYLVSLGTGTALSMLFVKDNGIIAVIAIIVVFWIIAQIVMNVFFSKVLNLQIGYFFKELSKGLTIVFALSCVMGYLVNLIPLEINWLSFSIKAFTLVISYILLLYNFGMNNIEKAITISMFDKFRKKP